MAELSLLLMGSKPAAVVALETAIERQWTVLGVVVSSHDPHPWLKGKRLEDVARNHGIPVYVQSTIPRELRATLVVSYMYRHRVRAETLRMAERAALNFHAAPLPEFGGWAFYSLAILECAQSYGCTCHHMDENFDSGPICEVRRFPIDSKRTTAWSLERLAQAEMIALFIDILKRVERGEVLPKIEQDRQKMRYLTREQFTALKRIPPNADAEVIERTARAFWYPPYECAYVELDGQRHEVLPSFVKQQLADLLHANDYHILKRIARNASTEARGG